MDTRGLLEPTQFAAATERKLPRRKLDRRVTALLVALRIYVMVAVPIVGYAFVHALMTQQ